MKYVRLEFTPKRLFGATPALIFAGLLWAYYCAALFLEFLSELRYSGIALGQWHIWTAAIAVFAMLIFCGVFWKRSRFTVGSYALGCLLGCTLTGLTGWYIEREFFHAAWNFEKSSLALILAGNALLLVVALLATPFVLRITRERATLETDEEA